MTVTARQNEHQVVHFIRKNIVFNQAGATAIQVSMGSALPANSAVLTTYVGVQTVFNAASTNTLDVGTAAAPTALVSASALGTVGMTPVAPATLGGILSSTADLELFVRYNYTGGSLTTGAGTVTVCYVPNI